MARSGPPSADGKHAKAVKHQGQEIEEARHANQKFSENRAYLVRLLRPSNHRYGLLPPSRVPLVAVEFLQNELGDLNLGPRSRSCIKLKNLEVQGYRDADACVKYAACRHSGC